jgi:hypothetical protein
MFVGKTVKSSSVLNIVLRVFLDLSPRSYKINSSYHAIIKGFITLFQEK